MIVKSINSVKKPLYINQDKEIIDPISKNMNSLLYKEANKLAKHYGLERYITKTRLDTQKFIDCFSGMSSDQLSDLIEYQLSMNKILETYNNLYLPRVKILEDKYSLSNKDIDIKN